MVDNMDDIRCPMCGKLNPADNDVCQFCEARLKPLTSPLSDQNNTSDDDWLGSLRSDSELSSSDDADWYEEDSSESEEGQRDPLAWLSSIEDSTETSHDADQPPAESLPQSDNQTEDEIDLPSWLASLDENEELQEAEKTSPDDLPDWLSEIGQNSESEEDEPDSIIPDPVSDDEGDQQLPERLPASEESKFDVSEIGDEEFGQGEFAEKTTQDLPEWLSAFDGPVGSESPETGSAEETMRVESLVQPNANFKGDDQLSEDEGAVPDLEGLPTEEENLPDWLQDKSDEAASIKPEDDEELLDWLSKATEEEAEEFPAELEKSRDTDESEWLVESEIEEFESTGEPEQEDQGDFSEEIFVAQSGQPLTGEDFQLDDEPDWLAELEPDAVDQMTSSLVDTDLPDPSAESAEWLSELASEVDGGSEGSDKPAEDHEAIPFAVDSEFDEELEALYLSEEPDWLADVAAEADAGESEYQDDEITPADLPAWLAAMRPVDAVVSSQIAAEDSQTEVETAGPLAGMENVLPAEINIFQIRKPEAFSVKLDVNDSQQKHIAMMLQMLKDEELPRPIDKPTPITTQRVLRWAIALLLLVVTFFALWSGTGFGEIPAAGVEVQAVRSAIEALPSQSPVLVAVDYEPGMSGEMDVIALSVLEHLLQNNALLTFVSTTPAGPILAENLLTLLGQSYDLTRTTQYINLGYIPGGAAGLQSLATFPVKFTLPYTFSGYDPWSVRVTPLSEIEAVSDFPLILIITDRQETARNWIEQVAPDLSKTAMVMAVSAQIGPYIRPYYKSSTQSVDGYVSGLPGSAAYESIVGLPDRAGGYWNVFSVLVIFSAGIIVIGGLVNLVMSTIKPRSSSEDKQKNES